MVVFTALLLSGCLTPPPASDVRSQVPISLLVTERDTALWNDPQFFPHPRYNWPTLTHVPAHAPKRWQPPFERALPERILGLNEVAGLSNVSSGADGIGVFGSLAVTPGNGFIDDTVDVIDLSDLSRPRALHSFRTDTETKSADLIAYPDGRLIVVLTTREADGILLLYDITEPTQPELVTFIDVPSGTHNVAIVPGTPILYNANTVGSGYFQELYGGRSLHQTEIYDLTHPDDPKLVQEWPNGYGCHDISFHIDPQVGRSRAYCAGFDAVQIWDIEDPLAPSIVSTFAFPYAQAAPGLPAPVLTSVAHSVVVNRDATVIAVSDEVGTQPPACTPTTNATGRTTAGPTGNLWFYDVSDETRPTLLSWLSPGPQSTKTDGMECTAHLGHMVPQQDRDLLAMTFYTGGLVLVDFSDATRPQIVDRWGPAGRAPVDAWYVQGHLVVADFRQGFDVLAFR